MRFGFWLALALWIPSLPLAASSAWTLDDLLLAEQIDSLVLSPDGGTAMWSRSAMDPEKGTRVSNLFSIRLTDGSPVGEPVQWTRGPWTVRSPKFSPDGKNLAFLSSRPLPEEGEKKAQVEPASVQLWMLSLSGGEAWPLTRLERAPQAFAWQGNGHLVFSAAERPELAELQQKKGEDTSQVVEDPATPLVRLFRLAVEGGKVERLTTNRDWIDDFALSPDGRWAVTVHRQSLAFEFDHKVTPTTELLDLESGESRRLLEGRLVPSRLAWENDSRGFYFIAPRSSHPLYLTATISVVYRFDVTTLRAQEVPLYWERGLASGAGLEITPDGFLTRLANGVRSEPARYRRNGESYEVLFLEGEHRSNLWRTALSADGRWLAYEHSRIDRPSQWFVSRLEDGKLVDPKQITSLHKGLAGKPLPRYEVVRFKGARGDEVEGLLRYPFDYREGETRPLILAPHGGPAAADFDDWGESWSYPMTLWLSRGALVLQVNYHGSSDYGLEWVESIANGKYYELEIPDLEAGVDHVISRGLADPNRLATLGWSNGGILSAELITRNPRYKAASIGAADVEWISDWGNVDFGASFDNYYFGASPLENPALYVAKSPFFRLGRVTTPTIVFTGTEDRNVPPSQSWSLFRALQQLGNTEVKLVLFPGEPHGLRKLAHQRRKVEEELAWLDRFLFTRQPSRSAAVREGSPLARTFARSRAARARGGFGVNEGGVLAPETVLVEGLRISRFEVTRAQFGAFDKGYAVPPGQGDFPASGISFEQAQRYTAWLAKKTGKLYRLPTAAEATALYEKAAKSSEANQLDHWAGYAPSPEATQSLRAVATTLGEGSLLAEVGRHDAYPEEPQLFDLGGNVAEWVTDTQGRGKLLGGSADQPRDPQGSGQTLPAYRGFRVVREDGKL